MADVETRLRATLTDRAAYLDDPAPYAVPPALVAGVAARAGHLRRRRTWTQVGGAAAAVTVVGLLAAAVVRGPDTAGPALPASSGTVSTSGWSDPGVGGSAAERSAAEASARASAQAAAEAARYLAISEVTELPNPLFRAENEIVRQFFSTDPAFRQQSGLAAGEVLGCGFDLHGKSETQAGLDWYRYAWMTCGGYLKERGVAVAQWGWSVPVRLHLTGGGSSLTVLGFDVPGDGSAYEPDIRRIFPADEAQTLLGTNSVRPQFARAALADAAVQLGLGPFGVTPLPRDTSSTVGFLSAPVVDIDPAVPASRALTTAAAAGALPADISTAVSLWQAGADVSALPDPRAQVFLALRDGAPVWVITVPVTKPGPTGGGAGSDLTWTSHCSIAVVVDATSGELVANGLECPSPFQNGNP